MVARHVALYGGTFSEAMANVEARFIVAVPARSVCDDNARALEHIGALRLLAVWAPAAKAPRASPRNARA